MGLENVFGCGEDNNRKEQQDSDCLEDDICFYKRNLLKLQCADCMGRDTACEDYMLYPF